MAGHPLVIDRVSKSYGDLRALDEMSFTVHPGETYGFVGANGAGKSTTMRIAMGVLAADSGQVLVGNQPMDDSLRRLVGYMPEERGLYPKASCESQLVYFARLHGMDKAAASQSASDLLEAFNLTDRKDDKVETLSLGNQQRVQLAAALVHRPQILILDEPFSGLDPIAVQVMADALQQRAAQGVPVLFSSHQLDLVQRLCDRVGIIRGGKMLAEGPVAQLRAAGSVILEVHCPTAPFGWAGNVPGVRSVAQKEGWTQVTLETDAPEDTDQLVLRAALSHGPVHHFARKLPTLTELYQEVIAQ
ncbi:ABC transporter ATP-binding protein [Corynebacterium ulceribovis]|uniref:ABC transporter ATP-binding protein n=1 Tax=Corynebacterium ulceribovis TaxID=487732 RepID=UPI0004775BB8|nr:ATP-binding cassette domain-containing protein [Corynebacterium ulceribovis]